MARSERTGKRKVRSCSTRVPDLGYYLVVTDAEKTEENYLMGLRNSLPKELQERIVIKVFPTKTENLVETCVELAAYHPQFCEPWIVLDRDRVPNFDELIREAEQSNLFPISSAIKAYKNNSFTVLWYKICAIQNFRKNLIL